MAAPYQDIPAISLAYPEPVTALAFDPVSDVIWSGSNSGNISAHCSYRGIRGVSFRAGDLSVHKLVAGENYVRASCVSGDGVGSWAKGGANKWFHKWASL